MFLTLLVVTFLVATIVSIIVAAAFHRAIRRILSRIIAEEISAAWARYLMFAMFVVGISTGVRVWDLEKYITRPPVEHAELVQLTTERWVLEVYRTVISTLQGLTFVLLAFFIITLAAFVVTRAFEMRAGSDAHARREAGRAPRPAASPTASPVPAAAALANE